MVIRSLPSASSPSASSRVYADACVIFTMSPNIRWTSGSASPPRASGEAERTGLLAQIRELPARHLVQVDLGGRRAHLDTGSGLGTRLEPTTAILCRQSRSMGCFPYLPVRMLGRTAPLGQENQIRRGQPGVRGYDTTACSVNPSLTCLRANPFTSDSYAA